LDASKEFGTEVTAKKAKYMFITLHQGAVQDHTLMTVNISFENVEKFRYLRKRVTNKN
jgi:hypothetical protein